MSPAARPVKTAVLPVAGLGTRFLPVTKSVPKEMLPLVDRPCIEYAVAEAVAAGVERVVMVVSRGKEALADYFDRNPVLERHLEEKNKDAQLALVRALSDMCDVVTIRQGEALGLGHAVLTARPGVGDQPFAVLLADDVIDAPTPAIGQLIECWEPERAVVALMEVPRLETRKYGVCAGEWLADDRMAVSAMVEKPAPEEAPSNHAIVGRYVLPPEIFGIIEQTPRGRGGEIQLTDALAVLASRRRVTGKVFDGQRFDTGNVLGWLDATLHFARKRPELADSVAEIIARHS